MSLPMGEPAPPSPTNRAMQVALITDEPRTEVLLLRHGQQHYMDDRAPRSQSQDPPLSQLGRDQAAALGREVERLGVTAVYSSQMRRAVETAEILRSQLSTTPRTEAIQQLREVEIFRDLSPDRPISDMLTSEALAQAGEEFIETRRFGAFPSAEPSEELRARALGVLERLVAEHEGERIAVVAHGGLINGFLAEVLGMEADMFFFPAHASVTRAVTRDGRWALVSANETSHLREAGGSLVSF